MRNVRFHQRRGKDKKILFLIFASFLLIIGIGYAILNSSLNINGTTGIANATWDIHWKSTAVTNGSVSGASVSQAPTITGTGNNTITYAVTLTNPGDFYEFTAVAENSGSIDGMISTISDKIYGSNHTEVSLPSYLDYTITYEDGTPIAQKHYLKSGETRTYKVRLAFKRDIEASQLPESSTALSFEYTVTYVQADNTAINVPTHDAFLANGSTFNAKAQLLAGGYASSETIKGLVNNSDGKIDYDDLDLDNWFRDFGACSTFIWPDDDNKITDEELYEKINTCGFNITATSIQMANELPSGFTPTKVNTISAANSSNPVYMWYDSSAQALKMYSEASNIYMDSDSSNMFRNLLTLTNLTGLSGLTSSSVTNMNSIFYGTGAGEYLNSSGLVLTGVSGWDTSHVTDMGYIFYSTVVPNLTPVGGWDTSSLTNLEWAFGFGSLGDVTPLSSWDTSHVTLINDIFGWTSGTHGTFTIKGNPTYYDGAFGNLYDPNDPPTLTLTVNYSRNTTNIDAIIATASGGNISVIKGVQID